MSKLDWFIIIGIAVAILLFIMVIISFVLLVRIKGKLKELENSRPKDKSKKRKWKREIKGLSRQRAKQLRILLLSLIVFLCVGAGTGYAKYYQSTNLDEQDTDNLVYGYYLLDQIENQLTDIDSDNDNEKKLEENIHTLSVQMSSYASKKGSDKGTEESQLMLNRYYARVGQFGVNLAAQNIEDLNKNQEEYLADIANIRDVQKKVLDFYKINEASLKQKK